MARTAGGSVRNVRAGSAAATLRSAAGNPALLRLLAAYTSFSVAEFGIWITLLVYAYDKYGATGATAIVLAQLLPSALLAPFTGTLADRRSPLLVLRGALLVQAVVLGSIALTVAERGPAPVVFVLGAVFTLVLDVTRPAQAALLPAVVRTPSELSTANALSAWGDGLGALVGPAVAGAAVSAGGVTSGVVVAASLNIAAAVLLAGHLGLRRLKPRPEPLQDSDSDGPVLVGLRATLATSTTRLLLVLTGLYYALVGALDVLCVVLAVSLLHIGGGGAGFLNAAIGGGAVAAGAFTIGLAGRRRLAALAAASLLLLAGAIALIGAFPTEGSAVILLVMIGGVGTAFIAASRILLQRLSPVDGTAAAFAAMEGVMSFGLASGAVVVRVGIAIGGLRGGFFAPAILGGLLVVLAATRLRTVDTAAPVPQVEIGLLRSIPIFAPLPSPELEGLARRLRQVQVPAGENVVTEGERGDRYYAVADGRLNVTRAGALLRTLARGSGFGEIALLGATRRTATVTAETAALLYSLDQESFLRVLTGHASSRAAVEGLMSSYEDDALEGLGGPIASPTPPLRERTGDGPPETEAERADNQTPSQSS